MCQAISGVAVLANETITVYTSDKTDSHTEIREEFNIRDDYGPGATRQTPIELIPISGLTDISGMEFRFDDCRPGWWTDAMTDEAIRQLFQAWRSRWNGNVLCFPSTLQLNSVTVIPEGTTFKAHNLYLNSVTVIPEGTAFDVDGTLHLNSVTVIPEGTTFDVDGDLYLNSVTAIPEWMTFKARTLHLNSVTVIPEGVTARAKRVFFKNDNQSTDFWKLN